MTSYLVTDVFAKAAANLINDIRLDWIAEIEMLTSNLDGHLLLACTSIGIEL